MIILQTAEKDEYGYTHLISKRLNVFDPDGWLRSNPFISGKYTKAGGYKYRNVVRYVRGNEIVIITGNQHEHEL